MPRCRDGRDQHALHALFLQGLQVALLLGGRIIRVGEDDNRVGGVGSILNAPRDLGKEGVGDIQHNQPNQRAVPGAQLPRGTITHKASFGNGLLHTQASVFRNQVRPIENIRDRAQRNPCQFSNTPNIGHKRAVSPFSRA